MDVIGVGTAFLDYYIEVDDSFLQQHQLELEKSGFFSESLRLTDILKTYPLLGTNPGGISINTLAVLSHLKAKTGYVGVVGTDTYGDQWLEQIKPVDTTQVMRAGTTSICACLLTHDRKHRTFVISLNEHDNDLLKTVDYSYLNSAKILYVAQLQVNYKETLPTLIELVQKVSGPMIALAPILLYMELSIEDVKPLIEKSGIVFFNQDELHNLLGKDYKDGSQELLALGAQTVVCTMGENGVYVATAHENFHVPAQKVETIVDATGAGDSFVAGFLSGILQNKSLRSSAELAVKVATASLGDYGVRGMKDHLA